MPVHTGKDSKGCYAQWGSKGKKYYYQCGSNSARKSAKAKASKQGAAAHAHGYTGNEGSKDMSVFRYVTTSVKSSVRKDNMEGRDWIVAPTQMITEGVHSGSDGPIFYPAEELAKIPSVWNHKPVVVYHPIVNGMSVSACDPDQLSIRKVGVLMNTEWNSETKKLGTETWLDPERVQTVDNRVAEAIDNNEMMEVSTGLYMDVDETPGEWNGEKYIGIAHNLQPDHLALLPDVKGACSIEDGAGFLRTNEQSRKLVINALSHDGVRSLLNSAIRETKENAWIEEIYDEYFIYEEEGKMFKQTYTKNDNSVSLDGLPKLVERQVTYKEISILAANNDASPDSKGENMDKEKIVSSLIANEQTSWSEDDKDALMALDGKMLTQMQESLGQEPEAKPEAKPEAEPEAEPEVKPEGEPTGNAAPKKLSAKEYVNQAPPEVKELLETSMATLNAEKSRLVKTIMANEKNTFTEEHLDSLHVNMLRAIANMAAPEKEESNDSFPLYLGNNGNPTANDEETPEPLLLPVMNFEKATA
jgi:hypothetical protein